jgi:Family of unknown function (DUF6455)
LIAGGLSVVLIHIKDRRGALPFSILVGMLEGVAIMAALTARELCPNHMGRMMQRLGIEPGGGVVPHLSLSYITAFHRCEACPSKQACRDWLDSLPASLLLAPRFCSNADIFFELQVDQPGAWIGKSPRFGARIVDSCQGQRR